MKRWITILLFVLTVPAIAYAVASGIQGHLNSELHAAIHRNYPNAPMDRIGKINLDLVCNTKEAQDNELCSTNKNLTLMKRGAIYAGLAAVLMLAFIKLLGMLTRISRALLVIMFLPGLYLTALFVIALILVHVVLTIGILYYAMDAFIHIEPIGLMVAFAIGAGIAILSLGAILIRQLRKATTSVFGYTLSREEAPSLWAHIDATANAVGALRPENIIVGLDPSFFVTEAKVYCLNGEVKGRTLYCSLPLCRILNKEEMTAVIGHELGHFKGQDTKYSEWFYPIYQGTTQSIAMLESRVSKGIEGIALLPAAIVLSFFLEAFSVAERRLSRARELAADEVGASVTSQRALAIALVKVHAFTGLWSAIQDGVASALRENRIFQNVSQIMAEVCTVNAKPNALKDITETHTAHPTDTHPPLSERLRQLGISIKDVADPVLNIPPPDPAIELVSNYEEREKNLSLAFQGYLARTLGITTEPKEARS